MQVMAWKNNKLISATVVVFQNNSCSERNSNRLWIVDTVDKDSPHILVNLDEKKNKKSIHCNYAKQFIIVYSSK